MKDNVIKVDFLKNKSKKRKFKKFDLLTLIKDFFRDLFSSASDTNLEQDINPDKKIINYSKYIS